jgi:molybdate-binding protein
VADLAAIRFVNREEGAALRKLLDSELARLGMPVSGIDGYAEEARSHFEGALRVAGGAADAALGLRIVAASLGLGFVPLATTRCDLVIPKDLRDQPGIAVLLDILQSSGLRKELRSLPGYDASEAGRMILG